MVEQNESITRLYRIGHTEIEITAPLSMKSPQNLEKFRIGQAKRPQALMWQHRSLCHYEDVSKALLHLCT